LQTLVGTNAESALEEANDGVDCEANKKEDNSYDKDNRNT